MSQGSLAGSQGGLVHKNIGYVSQGFSFEDWNWSSIRFALFIVVIAVMVALMAATIGLSVMQTEKCTFKFGWWQGPAVYHIPVGSHRDYGTDLNGDLDGVDFTMPYLQQLGVKIVLLSHVLPCFIPTWTLYTSFHGVDTRVGSQEKMRQVLQNFKKHGIHVILKMDISYTSVGHQWFVESERTSLKAGEKYEDFFTWRTQVYNGEH
jgi:hypothetical protein